MRNNYSSLKRVNVILIKDMVDGVDENGKERVIKAGDRVMRTTRTFAQKLVDSGNWAYCNKAKLKSFLNKDAKLSNNMRTMETMITITGENFKEQRSHGKVIAYIPTFKYKKPEMVIRDTEVNKAIEHKIRTNGLTFIKRFRKDDKSRFQKVTMNKVMRFNPTAKAQKNHRQNNPKQKLVGTGEKVLVLAY